VSSRIIDGKSTAEELHKRLTGAVAGLVERHGLRPGLAVVLVGDNPASRVYVRNKAKQTAAAGMRSLEHRLDAATGESELLALIAELNGDPEVHGILVQLPLPPHINEAAVLNAIAPHKDADGFHPVNAGLLASGSGDAVVPCTPLGCLMLIKNTVDDLAGMRAIIIGRSNIVGKPMAQLLLREHCTVTIAHSRTRDLPGECRRADIVVAAVGRPRLVGGDWIKPGAVVVDVGINRVDRGGGKPALVGDVDFAAAAAVAAAITPVPGGVGPMTIACLLHNTVTLACRAHGVESPL